MSRANSANGVRLWSIRNVHGIARMHRIRTILGESVSQVTTYGLTEDVPKTAAKWLPQLRHNGTLQ
jgi:hypothetical protein